MKARTSPIASPVRRCQERTSLWRTQRNDFARGGAAAGRHAGVSRTSGVSSMHGSATTGGGICSRRDDASSAGIAHPDRPIDELVGVRLRHLDRLVVGSELREDAPFLLGGARRHAAVAGEHGKLFLQYLQIRGAIGTADLGRNDGEDLFSR